MQSQNAFYTRRFLKIFLAQGSRKNSLLKGQKGYLLKDPKGFLLKDLKVSLLKDQKMFFIKEQKKFLIKDKNITKKFLSQETCTRF